MLCDCLLVCLQTYQRCPYVTSDVSENGQYAVVKYAIRSFPLTASWFALLGERELLGDLSDEAGLKDVLPQCC